MKKSGVPILFTLFLVLFSFQEAAAQKHQDADASHQQEANDYLGKINLASGIGPGLVDLLIPRFPEVYGGAYIGDSGKLIVYIIGDFDKGKSAIAKIIGSKNFIAKPGRYSYNTLNKLMNELNAFLLTKPKSAINANFTMACVRDDKNQIIIELEELTDSKIDEFKRMVMDSPAIVFKKSSGRVILE